MKHEVIAITAATALAVTGVANATGVKPRPPVKPPHDRPDDDDKPKLPLPDRDDEDDDDDGPKPPPIPEPPTPKPPVDPPVDPPQDPDPPIDPPVDPPVDPPIDTPPPGDPVPPAAAEFRYGYCLNGKYYDLVLGQHLSDSTYAGAVEAPNGGGGPCHELRAAITPLPPKPEQIVIRWCGKEWMNLSELAAFFNWSPKKLAKMLERYTGLERIR